ncbi:MAG: hypothetical protein DRQ89_12510 [Epsilonproteobacteria bacterium]|nr:MAG: hypothetical protein DRQ89_12510 [Campylobacterota bacterium]
MKTRKEEIQEVLRQGECEVIFRKANGDEREMICTLHSDYLPAVDPDAPKGESNETEDVVTVWDIEAAGWRRFRIDSILEGPVFN